MGIIIFRLFVTIEQKEKRLKAFILD